MACSPPATSCAARASSCGRSAMGRTWRDTCTPGSRPGRRARGRRHDRPLAQPGVASGSAGGASARPPRSHRRTFRAGVGAWSRDRDVAQRRQHDAGAGRQDHAGDAPGLVGRQGHRRAGGAIPVPGRQHGGGGACAVPPDAEAANARADRSARRRICVDPRRKRNAPGIDLLSQPDRALADRYRRSWRRLLRDDGKDGRESRRIGSRGGFQGSDRGRGTILEGGNDAPARNRDPRFPAQPRRREDKGTPATPAGGRGDLDERSRSCRRQGCRRRHGQRHQGFHREARRRATAPEDFIMTSEHAMSNIDQRTRLAREGMYSPDFEGAASSDGLVAATEGTPSRRVVQAAVDALKAVWHRGAVDADGMTGDGAGLHIDLPVKFFDDAIAASGHKPLPNRLAVGMIFLPRTDLGAQEACRTIVESVIIEEGYSIYGWRQVPVDVSVIGQKAQASRPEIEQIMIAGPTPDEASAAEFEKNLYLVRRRIEKRVIAAQIQGFYICSLSCRSIIYKGLILAESLSVFYPDQTDQRFESRVAIFHQRYSTNTFPQWWLAQPFRCLAHNGEVNTIRGNKNWMLSHEIRMASLAFGEQSEDIKPVIPAGASDTAALAAVFEAICRSGREAPTAKLMLVPEAWSEADTPPEHLPMYQYLASVMEPWDGPAALAMTAGRWADAGMDRNALRPLRNTQTDEGLLLVE